MTNPFVQFVALCSLGAYVVRFGRSTFSSPDAVRKRWFRTWQSSSSALLRPLAVVWIFGGFLMVAQGITAFGFFDRYRGSTLGAIILVVAAAATAIVLSFTPRRKLV